MAVTLKEISEEIGVSITTVYKALNNKPKVSDEMRKRVVAKAKELNYSPNKLAQGLARNRKVIGLIIPQYPKEFMRYVADGVHEIANELIDFNIRSIIKKPKNENETKASAIELISQNVDGIILLSNQDVPGINEVIKDMEAYETPVAAIVSEPLDGTPLVGMVRSNGFVLGRMAAQLLSLCVDKSKQVAIFIPDEDAVIHQECSESFLRESIQRGMSSAVLFKSSLKGEKATYKVTEKTIANNKDIGGIYVASNNSVSVCKCLEDMGRTDIAVVGHDLYPELAECIQRGSLIATLFQNQRLQAKEACEHMVRYITGDAKPFGNIYLRPEVVMMSNLECYKAQY